VPHNPNKQSGYSVVKLNRYGVSYPRRALLWHYWV